MKKLLLMIPIFLLVSCTNGDKARSVLEMNGYTNITMTGYSPFSCDEKDSFSDGFNATNPYGVKVSGVVCSGWLKGATIRF